MYALHLLEGVLQFRIMAQLDRAGLCEFPEYQKAFNERLKAGQLTDGEILMLYLRLERMGMAIKTPAQTITFGHNMGKLVVGILLLVDERDYS